jgi:hypothetical protein
VVMQRSRPGQVAITGRRAAPALHDPGTIEAWHDVVAQSIKGWATGYLHQAAATLSALAMSSMIIKAAPKKPTRSCGMVLDVLFMA